jgi:hypothetical protein
MVVVGGGGAADGFWLMTTLSDATTIVAVRTAPVFGTAVT